MILLVDNYDSFTYNLAQYIGKFDEVQVLRNDDPDLYQVAQEADAFGLSPGPGWPKGCGQDGGDDPRFRGSNQSWGFVWDIKRLRKLWRALGIGTTGHAWQTKPDPARSSFRYTRVSQKKSQSCATIR